jgi:hypothetical protein
MLVLFAIAFARGQETALADPSKLSETLGLVIPFAHVDCHPFARGTPSVRPFALGGRLNWLEKTQPFAMVEMLAN